MGQGAAQRRALVKAPSTAGYRLDDALDAERRHQVLDAPPVTAWRLWRCSCLTTGVRQGEALRLRWADIDLDRRTARVVKAKTAAGVRTIALPPMAVAALRRHRSRPAAGAGRPLPSGSIRAWCSPPTVGAPMPRRSTSAGGTSSPSGPGSAVAASTPRGTPRPR